VPRPCSLSFWKKEVQTTLAEVVRDNSSVDGVHESVMTYISGLATHLINARDFAPDTWKKQVTISSSTSYPTLCTICGASPGHASPAIMMFCAAPDSSRSQTLPQVVQPYLGDLIPEAELQKVNEVFLQRCLKEIASKEKEDLEENEGEDLCNCEFSLAYGMLLCLAPCAAATVRHVLLLLPATGCLMP
jgi:hypothetical protein